MQAKEHRVLDRAAMIEAASRSLRQQMRARDRPRSKGSLHDVREQGSVGCESPQTETSQRRIHSAENKYRIVSSQRDGADNVNSASSSALDTYPAEEEPGQTVQSTTGLDDVPPLGELKRPMSRKKVPAASAAAGLGACSNPVKIIDAFEQRKTRQPIPVESWGPRPPSRGHRLPPNATLLDVGLLSTSGVDEDRVEPKLIATGASRSRSEGGRESVSGRPGSKAGSESVVSSTWAHARYAPHALGSPGLSEPRRGRKAKEWGAPEELSLGILGVSGTRSPNGQQLSKNLSGVFDHHSPLSLGEFRDRDARQASHAGSWASHVDTAGTLEVSGSALGEDKGLWLCSPVSSVGSHPLPSRKSRHPEAVSVEDVEADQDAGIRAASFRRDTPPQVILTRSSQQKKERGDLRRGRDDRLLNSANSMPARTACNTNNMPARAACQRGRQNSANGMPFGTSLDVDFLSLFAL